MKYRNFASKELMSDAADDISLSLRLAAREILWLRKLSLDYEGEGSPAHSAVTEITKTALFSVVDAHNAIAPLLGWEAPKQVEDTLASIADALGADIEWFNDVLERPPWTRDKS